MKTAGRNLLLLALLALFLAACGGPEPQGGEPTMTRAEFDSATSQLTGDMLAVSSRAAQSQGLTALRSLPDGGPDALMPMAAPRAGDPPSGEDASRIEPQSHGGPHLPRGTYTYDEAAGTWEGTTAETGNLILQWSYEDATGSSHDAELTVDWDVGNPTELVEHYGEVIEAPTDARATLTVDGTEAGRLDLDADWYDASACDDPILEPASFSLAGYIGGQNGRVDVDVSTSISDTGSSDSVSTQGSVTATAGEDSASFDWNVNANGTISRDADCQITDMNVTDGSVAFGAASNVGGDGHSFDIAFDFDDVEVTQPGKQVSASLTGGVITIDDQEAVTFAGTLDDENANGTPGDNVTLTFSDGATVELESFLMSHFGGLTPQR